MSNPYTVQLLNDLHNHFPELLYNHQRFQTGADILSYVNNIVRLTPSHTAFHYYQQQYHAYYHPQHARQIVDDLHMPPPASYPPSPTYPPPSAADTDKSKEVPAATAATAANAANAANADASAKEKPAATAANVAPPNAAAAPAGPAAPKGPPQKDTSFMDSNRFYRWIVSLLEGIWKWIKDLFTGAFNEKFEALRKQFSADELFKLFGTNPDQKIEKATGVFQEQAEKLQRLVATGIGGAASASIDMILNAFSMSPVFGTTILVWRMFQNMLMIMCASLSVQAASNSTSTTLATIANPEEAKKMAGGARSNAKNNVTKRIKTDIRQLNRSLKRYMHFPHHRKGTTGITMSGSGAGSGYSYT